MKDPSEKFRKLISWIAFLSIIGIVFTSIFPWVSVSKTLPIEGKMFYNFETMKNSNDENIITLSEKVNIINILFFLILILVIFSYIFLIIYKTQKYSSLPQILIIIGSCTILVTCVLINYLIYSFSEAVNNTEYMSTPYVFASFQYSHIILIIGIVLLIISAASTSVIIMYSYDYFKYEAKGKKSSQKILKGKAEKKLDLKEASAGVKKSKKSVTIKHEEIEDWLKDEVHNIEKHSESIKKLTADFYEEEQVEKPKTQDKIKETFSKKDLPRIPEEKPIKKGVIPLGNPFDEQDNTPIKIKETGKTYDSGMTKSSFSENEDVKVKPVQKLETDLTFSKKPKSEPFKSEVKKTEVKIPDDLVLTDSFDKVLSSVIEKRQKETKRSSDFDQKDKTLERYDENAEVEKSELNGEKITTFTVRCPMCKNVFSVKKTGEITKIKCPKCGKEGVVK